jgi:hypothetical protein
MCRTSSLSSVVVLAVLFILGLAAEVFGSESVTVTGVLAQDSEGALELQTPDFIYFVQGSLPESLVGKSVTLSGRLARGEQGTSWIIVTDGAEAIETANGSGR